MSEEMVVRNCSPTLAGLKTANMFVCSFPNETVMRSSISHLNKMLNKKGIRVLPLRYKNSKALIYIYRPGKLKGDLSNDVAYRILLERGYTDGSSERYIAQLVKRLALCEDFPHEIGLFLGYPPEDVRGFIENRNDKVKCVGCWKVYSDVENARKSFAKFKKCTDVYCSLYKKGRSIERLTIAV